MPSIVALIPARAGSKRIPGKNTKLLGGKPLIEWTMEAARASGIFSTIVVCSDDKAAINIASQSTYADYDWRHPSPDDEPDIEWVRQMLVSTANSDRNPLKVSEWQNIDVFAILRPTSPFRTADTIRRAWQKFQECQPCDSLRAIRPVREHPGKMWTLDAKKNRLMPIMPYKHPDGTPWHSSPTQTLKPVYVQTASLEIAWTRTVRDTGTISGDHIVPFHCDALEGLDLNTLDDWREAERLIADGVPA